MTEANAIDATCGGLLPESARPSAPAVFAADGAVALTQQALRDQVADLAQALKGRRKGLALLLCRNEPAVLIAFLALLAAGHAVALLDTGLDPIALERLIGAYSPDLVVSLAGDAGAVAAGDWTRQDLGDLTVLRAETPLDAAIAPELSVLLSTSGTTGSAKFVRLSSRNIAANADQIASVLDIGADDVGVAHLPLHYSYGLSVITSHLRSGAAVHLWPDSVTIPEFWAATARAGGTHFPGVPFHYNFLARSDIAKLAPPSMKTFTQAGGALDQRLQTRMHQMLEAAGRRFFVMYGQTEAAPRITTLPHERLPDKLGSVGPALPKGILSVVDENDAAVPARAVGRVIYLGPNVMLGYAERREDLALGDMQGGRIETGDLGWLDEDGYLYLTGRAKRFAKLFGLRISLDEVEARFRAAGEAAAVEGRDKITLYTADAAAVRDLAPTVAAEYKLPTSCFAVKEIAEIPRKSSGKTDYAQLEKLP